VPLEHLPHTAAFLWEKISGSVWRQWALVMDVKTPPYILRVLAQDANELMHQLIAAHPSTSLEILARLAQDTDRNVRRDVATNPSTPLEILARLAHDANTDVQWGVAVNPSTLLEDL
jgi:hypothetical protein